MKQNRPKEMTLIGSLYIFEAIIVLLALVVGGEEGLYIGVREIVSDIPANILIPILTMLKLFIAYGYLKLKNWGYWLMMLYSLVVILMNSYLMLQFGLQLYIWQTMFSVYVLRYTYQKRSVFSNIQPENQEISN